MKTSILSRALTVSLALFLVCGAAAAPSASAAPPEKVVLQLKWRHQFQFAGYYAAQKNGYFREEGLDVALREGAPAIPFIPSLLRGDYDYLVADADILLARMTGKPVVVLAVIYQHSPYVLLTRDRGISRPSDLIGRTVMLSNQEEEAPIKAMFLREGVPLEKIRFVSHTWNFADLIDGKTDAITAYSTDDSPVFRERGFVPGVLRPQEYGIDFYGDALATTEREISSHPRRAAAFRRASLKGWEYAFAHSEEMIDYILGLEGVRERGITRDFLRREVARMREIILPEMIEIGHMNPGRWEQMAKTYVQLGMFTGSYSLEGFCYDPQVRPAWLRMVFWVAVGGLVLGGLALVWILQLRRVVGRRTGDLREEIRLRRAKEDALRESEERYRGLFDDSPVGLWEEDNSELVKVIEELRASGVEDLERHLTEHPDVVLHCMAKMRIVDVNRAAMNMYQADSKEELFAKFPPTLSERSVTLFRKALLCMAEGRTSMSGETTNRSLKGDEFQVYFTWSVAPGYETTYGRVYFSEVDITERKRSEEALKRSREQMDAVVANAPIVLWAVDRDGKFTLSEGKALELLGLSPGRVVGLSVFEVYKDSPQVLSDVRRALSGEAFSSIVEVGAIVFESNYVPLRDPEGGIAGVLGVATDVTERTRREARLQQASKMEAVGRLAGGIAHDFNNLLTAITGYGELLLLRLGPQHPLQREVREILKAGEYAATLTGQLLAFSRKQLLRPKVIVLNALVADMDRMLRRMIGEDIHVVTRLDPALWAVRADPGQMEQVLMNLIVNARDAMPSGGSLTIETANAVLDDGYAHQHPGVVPGEYVKLVVSDTGHGMDAESADKAFEPFFTTKESGKGTGLGLSTVHGIVEQSGGQISVSSIVGRGTTFTIYLPRVDGIAEERSAPAVLSSAREGSETVLVVEDSNSLRQMVREVLAGSGYLVLLADSGAEAIRIAEGHRGTIHLLLTDVVMPGMGGRELADRLSALRPEIRVLYMSGYTDDAVVRRGVSDAGLPFIGKPFKPADLLRMIRTLLGPAA